MRRLALTFLLLAAHAIGADTAAVPMADGFDIPVGRDGTKKYFRARGFRAYSHLGDDWNGVGGGDTDLGDPVYSTANGIVVYARDYRADWGNVVIVRHAYLEGGKTQFVDSLYGHLHEILVREGEILQRGKKLGTIGNNRGMYPAHLHFEMRKNLQVGVNRGNFPRNTETYWDPNAFIEARRKLAGTGTLAVIPTNTFSAAAAGVGQSSPTRGFSPVRSTRTFTIDRYSDMRK